LIFFPVLFPSKISYQRLLHKRTGEDVVLKWTSVTPIQYAKWGTKNTVFIVVDSSVVHLNPALANTRYYGRVSFVGNLTAGHAWFKISNLTIRDSDGYAVQIREQGYIEASLTTSLVVLGKILHF